MNVILADTCWNHHDSSWIHALCDLLVALGRRTHHPIAGDADRMERWCQSKIPAYVEIVRARLLGSTLRSNALQITIAPDGASAIAGSPPWTLTAGAALPLVEKPLCVFLENDESDLMFMQAMNIGIDGLIHSSAIEISHGGGSTMQAKIARAGANLQAQWRSFFIFDSDRLHPTELNPSWVPPRGDGCQGHIFETACAVSNVPQSRWHMLRRRSIENYLPLAVLSARDAACAAVLSSPSVGCMLYYYNMKKGLDGDGVWPLNPSKQVRASRSCGAWSALSTADRDGLQSGFGSNVAEEFRNVGSTHRWESDILAEADVLLAALYDAL